jgi:beta-lactamase class A
MVHLHRRGLLGLTASALSAAAPTGALAGPGSEGLVKAAVARFAELPAQASCLVVTEHPTAPWQVSHHPDARLFVGSAVKTFILAQFLREMEAGRLSEDQQMPINDAVRSLISPVFLKLSGTTQARAVLEAMIAHSDNTATDAVLAAVGATQVRALIREAGLQATQIPDSTRRLISYLAGAPEGVDLGWEGMQRLENSNLAGIGRPALNDHQTMASTANDMVLWYRRALRGEFFKAPATLVEFKRIQAMADAGPYVVPADTVAYAKGGSIDWEDFHCLCLSGQMIVGTVPVTFCFTINWAGPNDGVPAIFQSSKSAVADVLREAARAAA